MIFCRHNFCSCRYKISFFIFGQESRQTVTEKFLNTPPYLFLFQLFFFLRGCQSEQTKNCQQGKYFMEYFSATHQVRVNRNRLELSYQLILYFLCPTVISNL